MGAGVEDDFHVTPAKRADRQLVADPIKANDCGPDERGPTLRKGRQVGQQVFGMHAGLNVGDLVVLGCIGRLRPGRGVPCLSVSHSCQERGHCNRTKHSCPQSKSGLFEMYVQPLRWRLTAGNIGPRPRNGLCAPASKKSQEHCFQGLAIVVMERITRVLLLGFGIAAISFTSLSFGKDVRINLPKRDRTTPVQKLNRDGVEAISKHQYEKARDMFYEAYLLDPDDPFTLNNLGYVAELAGDVERAQRFYELSAQNATEAVVDRSSSEMVEGQSLKVAVSDIPSGPMHVNYTNVQAVRLLSQGRAAEADVLLQRALKAEPKNAFTLNNMGVTKEMEGETDQAIKFYDLSAAQHSAEKVIVTLDSGARGKPVSEMAAESAKRLRRRLQNGEGDDAKAARLNLQGVSALNRNELDTARKLFRQAYALGPLQRLLFEQYRVPGRDGWRSGDSAILLRKRSQRAERRHPRWPGHFQSSTRQEALRSCQHQRPKGGGPHGSRAPGEAAESRAHPAAAQRQ